MTQFDDEVEKVLLSLLIEEGYLKEGDRKNPKAILAAHESWMADIRTKREDEEAARRPS